MHQILLLSLRLLPLIMALARAKEVEPLQRDHRSCRNTIKDHVNGDIDYPGTGGNYQNDAKCRWDITVSCEKQIEVKFLRFGTADQGDTLTVKNGPKGTTIGIYSGQGDLPKPFITSGNQLYLFFKSDSTRTNIGFAIEWRTFDEETMNQCLANSTSNSELWLKIDESEGTIGTKIDDMGNKLDVKLDNLTGGQGTIGTKIDDMGNELDANLAILTGGQGTIETLVGAMGNELGTCCSTIETKINDMGNELDVKLANLTGGQGTIRTKIDGIGNDLDANLAILTGGQGTIETLVGDMGTELGNCCSTIGTKLDDMGNELDVKLDNLTGGQDTIGTKIDGIGNELDANLAILTGGQGTIETMVGDMGNDLDNCCSTIGTKIDDMGNELAVKLANLTGGQGTIGTTIDGIGNELDANLVILTGGQGIIGTKIDAMGSGLDTKLSILTGGQGSMESKMNEILTKLDTCLENSLQTEQDCRDLGGETMIGNLCLMFSKESVTWGYAKEACADFEGGRLAVVTQDPMSVLRYVINVYGSAIFWLGANDIVTEGSWNWANGQPMGNIFPWANGQPDNKGNDEDCLMVNWSGGYHDDNCRHVWRYICELGIGNTPRTKKIVQNKLEELPESMIVNGSDFESLGNTPRTKKIVQTKLEELPESMIVNGSDFEITPK